MSHVAAVVVCGLFTRATMRVVIGKVKEVRRWVGAVGGVSVGVKIAEAELLKTIRRLKQKGKHHDNLNKKSSWLTDEDSS